MTLNLQQFRQRLQDEIDNLFISMREAQGGAAMVVLDQTSVGRISRMDAMQQQAMAQALRERMQLSQRRLKAALNRIDAGTFGICCQCEEILDAAQLDADPAAVFCRACIADRRNQDRG